MPTAYVVNFEATNLGQTLGGTLRKASMSAACFGNSDRDGDTVLSIDIGIFAVAPGAATQLSRI
jgi:hypothetical protein